MRMQYRAGIRERKLHARAHWGISVGGGGGRVIGRKLSLSSAAWEQITIVTRADRRN